MMYVHCETLGKCLAETAIEIRIPMRERVSIAVFI